MRTYSLDPNSNGTALNSYAGSIGGACSALDPGTTPRVVGPARPTWRTGSPTTVSGAATGTGTDAYDGLGRFSAARMREGSRDDVSSGLAAHPR